MQPESTAPTLLQGIPSGAFDVAPATTRLGGVLSAAAASFGGVVQSLHSYLARHKAVPAAVAQSPTGGADRSWASWSYLCAEDGSSSVGEETEESDEEQQQGADADDDGSSCCSVADTVYSLPDVVSHHEELSIDPCWAVRASLPLHPHGIKQHGQQQQHLPAALVQQLSGRGDGGATFVLPRNLFIPATPMAPTLKRNRRQRNPRNCHTSEGSLVGLELHACTLHRATASWFLPSSQQGLLCLPAPVFLPDSLEVGLFCDKGARARNEDSAFFTRLDPSMHEACGFTKSVCFGVFDGHGGADVAEHLTECLPGLVAQRCRHIEERGVEEIAMMLQGVEQELKHRFHAEWQPEDRDPGSTALVAAVMDDTLLVANVGDCRLLLISEAVDHSGNRTAFVSNTTTDHHCGRNPTEAARVRQAGARIDESGYIGSLLEVSRSIGDFQTKSELGSGVIISEPEVYTWKLGAQDLLAVAVSDGISSVMDDMAICNMVCTHLNDRKRTNDPAHAARELASFAALSSTDNCSAVVVVLKDAPPPAPARRRLFGRKAV